MEKENLGLYVIVEHLHKRCFKRMTVLGGFNRHGKPVIVTDGNLCKALLPVGYRYIPFPHREGGVITNGSEEFLVARLNDVSSCF